LNGFPGTLTVDVVLTLTTAGLTILASSAKDWGKPVTSVRPLSLRHDAVKTIKTAVRIKKTLLMSKVFNLFLSMTSSVIEKFRLFH
jgi:hypothetical protein